MEQNELLASVCRLCSFICLYVLCQLSLLYLRLIMSCSTDGIYLIVQETYSWNSELYDTME